MEIATEKILYLVLMLGIWLTLFVAIGRLVFFDSFGKFGMALVYALFVPTGLAFLMGEWEQDRDSGMAIVWLLIITIIVTYSFHAGMGETIQGLMGIEPPPES